MVEKKDLWSIIQNMSDRRFRRFISDCFAIIGVALTYNFLRVNKDLLIATEDKGIALISFIKSTCVVLFAFVVSSLYPILVRRLKRTEFLNYTILFFLSYYVFHLFVVGDNLKRFHLDFFEKGILSIARPLEGSTVGTVVWNTISRWLANIGGLIDIWSTTLYYSLAETWGTVGFAILFYLHVNEASINKEEQTSLGFFYIVCCQLFSLGGFVLYNAAVQFLELQQPYEIIRFGTTLAIISFLITWASLYYSVSDCIADNNIPTYQNTRSIEQKEFDIFVVIKDIINSPSVFYITSAIILYSTSMTLVEQIGKGYLLEWSAGNTAVQLKFTTTWLAIQSLIAACLSLGSAVFALGTEWIIFALLTPFALLISGSVVIYSESLYPIACGLPFIGSYITSLGYFQALTGSFQSAFTKVFKYVFFDNTREMYVFAAPTEEKIQIKNSADLLGSRLGKGLGSLYIGTIVSSFLTPDITGPEAFKKSVPILATSFYITVALLILCYLQMNPIYTERIQANTNVKSGATEDNETVLTEEADISQQEGQSTDANSSEDDTDDVIDIQSLIDDIEDVTQKEVDE